MNPLEMLNRKKQEAIRAAAQPLPVLPRKVIKIEKVDPYRAFVDDRVYDKELTGGEDLPNMHTVQRLLRKEQKEEFVDREENLKTLNFVRETDDRHPYDTYFERRRDDERNR